MAKVQNQKGTVSKKSTSSKTKKTNTKNELIQKEITGIFIVAFAVFLIVVTTKENQTGIIGRTINTFTHSFFGRGADMLPFFILAIGIMRLLNIIVFTDNNQVVALIGFFSVFYNVCFSFKCRNFKRS